MATYRSQFTGQQIDERLAAVDDCARVDGQYENLGAGTAEQLASSVVINDKVPYNYRTSGGSVDIGNRKTEKIIGGTIAWNQQFKKVSEETFIPSGNSNTTHTKTGEVLHISVNGNNTAKYAALSVNRITSLIQGRVGHKFLIGFKLVATSGYDAYVAFNTGGRVYGGTPNNYYFAIAEAANNSVMQIGTNPNVVMTTSDYVEVTDIMCFDLTQLFGSAIADYLYTLESGTAGAGVAKFRQLFPKPYYANNAGELMSVKVSKAVMTGFNQWDEEWEVGTIDLTTGQNADGANYFRSENYIPVVPSTSYYIKSSGQGLYLFLYDAVKNYIEYRIKADVETVFPSNARYMRFVNVNTNIYDKNTKPICFNLHWDGERDGEYESFKKNEYALDPDLELRGIWKLDSNNDIYCDGDEYESDSKVTRRYGIVDLGTLNWSKVSGGGGHSRFNASLLGLKDNPSATANSVGLKCMRYLPITPNDTWFGYAIGISSNIGSSTLLIYDSAYESGDAATFKAAMSGVYLVYELATPTEETAEPYTNPMIVDDFGTEEFVDERDVAVPVGHDTDYMANLRAKLEMSPNSPDGDGDYIVRQTNGQNSYVELSSTTTIQQIIARLEALEGNASE